MVEQRLAKAKIVGSSPISRSEVSGAFQRENETSRASPKERGMAAHAREPTSSGRGAEMLIPLHDLFMRV